MQEITTETDNNEEEEEEKKSQINDKENELKDNNSKETKIFRTAKEVFVFMHSEARVSRDLRAKWFFQNLDKFFEVKLNINMENSFPLNLSDIEIIGLIPNDTDPVKEGEKLRLTSDTRVHFLSNFYRFVFIIDLSPSSFVAEDKCCVLYNKIIRNVINCVRNLCKKFKVNGGNSIFFPQIYATFCAFSPFLAFVDDSVLLQSIILNEKTVDQVISALLRKIKRYIDNLCKFSQPYLKEWNRVRRKCMTNNKFSLNYDNSTFSDDSFNLKHSNLSPILLEDNIFTLADPGFISSDCALIFMLRMGLMAVKMSDSINAQSNIIIFTDGIYGVPNTFALQSILTQLREFPIICSFIKLKDESLRGPAVGNISFPENLYFISASTFGVLLHENELFNAYPDFVYNIFHKSFLTWSFQQTFIQNFHIPNILPNGFHFTRVRNRCIRHAYETNLIKLLYLRLREGFSIKQIQTRDDRIIIKLSLLWKPQILIEYVINALWSDDLNKKCKIYVEIYIDSSSNSIIELLNESESIKLAVRNLNDVDCLLLHLHLFNSEKQYYTLPDEFDHSTPFFEYCKSVEKPVLNSKYECIKNSKFILYWQPICAMDERILQKWARMHMIRLVLAYDLPLPDCIFTPITKKRFKNISSLHAYQKLQTTLTQQSTFTLVKDYIYVKIVYNDENENIPTFFYIIKVCIENSFVLLKLIFLGDVNFKVRTKVTETLRTSLEALRIKRQASYVSATDAASNLPIIDENFTKKITTLTYETNLLLVLQKPLEHILVNYCKLPHSLMHIARIERSKNLQINCEMLMHNSIAHYLSCRRQIWNLRGIFLRNMFLSPLCLEFIMQTILRRRLNQGFHIVYGKNGILNLVRQRHGSQTKTGKFCIDQCVLFSPVRTDNASYNRKKKQKKKTETNDECKSQKSNGFDSSNNILVTSWTQLIAEIWTEPNDLLTEQNVSELDTDQKLLEENNVIVRTLFTFEHWISACNLKVWSEKPYYFDDTNDIEHYGDLSLFNKDKSSRSYSAVDCFLNAFDLKELFEQANEKEVMFLPALSPNNDPYCKIRLSILLNKIHKELADSYDACIEIPKEYIPSCMFKAMNEHILKENGNDNQKNLQKSESCIKSENCLVVNNEPKSFFNSSQKSNKSFENSHSISNSLSPSIRSSSSFPFEVKANISSDNQINLPIYKKSNFDNSSFSDLLCEQRSTSVPLLLVSEKNDNNEVDKNIVSENLSSSVFNSELDTTKNYSNSTLFSNTKTSEPLSATKKKLILNIGKSQSVNIDEFPTSTVSNTNLTESSILKFDDSEITQESLNLKKKFASAFSNNELTSNSKASIYNQTNKNSATLSFDSFPKNDETSINNTKEYQDSFGIKENVTDNSNNDKDVFLKLFVKRLSEKQLLFFLIPRDIKTIQSIAPNILQYNMFPVFVFYCNKAIIGHRLSTAEIGLASTEKYVDEIIVENFSNKAETSTIADLRNQINRQNKREKQKLLNEKNLIEIFFATKSSNSEEENVNNNPENNNTEIISDNSIYTDFILVSYCELVFEEYIFTKCYISTVYTCLGQEIYVPSYVLSEALEYRCEHVRIDIGLINEILYDTCAHMKEIGLNSSSKKLKSLFSSSSSSNLLSKSSASSTASEDEDNELDDFFFPIYNNLKTKKNDEKISNNNKKLKTKDTKIEKKDKKIDSNCKSLTIDYDDICEDELADFRQSFDKLLKQNFFIKVPGLTDYFFYWPKADLFPMPSIKNVSKRPSDAFNELTNSNSSKSSDNDSLNDSSSLRNFALSLDNKQENTKNKNLDIESSQDFFKEYQIVNETKNSTCDEYEYYENCPLFIQFSTSIYLNGEVYAFSIKSIPNCLIDIFNKCSLLFQEIDLVSIDVSIEMYVFTWPHSNQCPFLQLSLLYDNNISNNITDDDLNKISTPETEIENFDNSKMKYYFSAENEEKSFIEKCSILKFNKTGDNTDIFEQPLDFVRQIPVHEHRILRKVQRNIQRMLKIEYILIMSREFNKKPKLLTLHRIMKFISDEIQCNNKTLQPISINDVQFEMDVKELLFVYDSNVGLNRLCKRFSNMKIDYVTLKHLKKKRRKKNVQNKVVGKRFSKFLNDNVNCEHNVIFYSCCVDEFDNPSFKERQNKLFFKSFINNKKSQCSEKNEQVSVNNSEFVEHQIKTDYSISSETNISPKKSFNQTLDGTFDTEKSFVFNDDEIDNDENNKKLSNTKMNLINNSQESDNNINAAKNKSQRLGGHAKHLINDFWLILQVFQKEGNNCIKIYFCQRSPLIHSNLFSRACQVIEEQIKLVNQELLLERMQKYEECDQLLVDNDNISDIDCFETTQDSEGSDIQLGYPLSKHAQKFAQRPTHSKQNFENFYSDEEETGINEIVRFKFRPGFFACDMMWHYWFPIHPRLKATRGSSGSDIGFKALRLGLEGLAVRNRSNMYVYREKTGNVVYMRLHSSEESIFQNITLNSKSWKNEVERNIGSCILLSVHGIRSPGEEITEQLRYILHRRLNLRTLEIFQNALMKNAQLRLEWCDIKFIQRDSQNPTSVLYFTVPNIAKNYLLAIQYYLIQQFQTLFISPKYRDHNSLHTNISTNHFTISKSSMEDFNSFSSLKKTFDESETLVSSNKTLSFIPYIMPNAPPNPENYVPLFFLVNKPSGEGKRNTGIACFEVKLIDWRGAVIEKFDQLYFDSSTRDLLKPGLSTNDRLKNIARFKNLSKCIYVPKLIKENFVPDTCALFQFNVWKNGNVDINEMQTCLNMCVQQAISDLITEFGLLSVPIFEKHAAFRLKTNSFNYSAPLRRFEPLQSTSTINSHFNLPQKIQNDEARLGSLSSFNTSENQQPFFESTIPTINEQQEFYRQNIIKSSPNRNLDFYYSQYDSYIGQNILQRPITKSPIRNRSFSANQSNLMPTEFLKLEFVNIAAEWFDFVYSETKNYPEMSQSVRKFNFLLDSDGSARKIIQVVYERVKNILKKEKVVICQSSNNAFCTSRRLQTLLSVTSLLDPFERDIGRLVNIEEDYTTDIVLFAYPEKQFLNLLNYGHNLSTPIPQSLLKLADSTQSSNYKFLPSLHPFIPRQQIIYLIVRGENITLFCYNYINDIVYQIKEIVERSILWYNARSRLLREIGLHKMGVTHLSTLKSADMKFNSYLLLTWMDPETLVHNDYPIDNLTTPDFSKLPPLYSQFLLKLYRFTDPAFVDKNLSPYPFEDQTQQMLTLREDVRSILNNQRLFQEIHKQLLANNPNLNKDYFDRIICRSRLVHSVQSPLLLFSSWRQIIATIRTGSEISKKDSVKSSRDFSKKSLKFYSKQSDYTFIEKDEEAYMLRIQQMLIDDYIDYLKLIGLAVINFTEPKIKNNENNVNEPTSTWMYLALPGGILFINLHFVKPYFCVRFLQWNNLSPIVIRNSTNFENEIKIFKELESKKIELIQKCHVHSFTYDFHLRIFARYLIGGQQQLFNPGYNTNAFLIDFLQYYKCRPPCARNCVYEKVISHSNLIVSSSDIWKYFLDNEQKFDWNVVRIKIFDPNFSDEFMLVSKKDLKLLNQPYKSFRIVLNQEYQFAKNSKPNHYLQQTSNNINILTSSVVTAKKTSTKKNAINEINLKFYLILVAEKLIYPVIEDIEEGSDVDEHDLKLKGEFKCIKTSNKAKNLLFNKKDSINFGKENDEDYNYYNLKNEKIQSKKLDTFYKNYKLINLSSTNLSQLFEKKRKLNFSEKNLMLSINQKFDKTLKNVFIKYGRRHSDSVLYLNSIFKDSKYSKLPMSNTDPEIKSLIANIKTKSKDLGCGVVVPPENIVYFHYFSNVQRKLQSFLKNAVNEKRLELIKFIEETDKLCHVDNLWKLLLSSKSTDIRRQTTLFPKSELITVQTPESNSNSVFQKSLGTTETVEMDSSDFDTLLKEIQIEPMAGEEPRLDQILSDVNFQSLCHFLLHYFEGERRCRYFVRGQKKYLFITNPSFLDSTAMFCNYQSKTELFFLFKNTRISNIENKPFSTNAIHKQFEDVMSSLCAYIWMELNHNSSMLL